LTLLALVFECYILVVARAPSPFSLLPTSTTPRPQSESITTIFHVWDHVFPFFPLPTLPPPFEPVLRKHTLVSFFLVKTHRFFIRAPLKTGTDRRAAAQSFSGNLIFAITSGLSGSSKVNLGARFSQFDLNGAFSAASALYGAQNCQAQNRPMILKTRIACIQRRVVDGTHFFSAAPFQTITPINPI